MPDYKTNIEIGTTFKGEGAKQAEQAMRNIRDASDGSRKNMDDARKSLKNYGEGASGVESAFRSAGKAVTALAIPAFVTGSVKSYLATVGTSTPLGEAWAVQTDKIGKAYYELGGILAQSVLPLMREAAELAETIAGWAKDNPGATTAIAGTAAAGGAGVGIFNTLKTIGLLGGGAGAAGAAGNVAKVGAAGGGVLGGVGAGLGGIVAGLGLNEVMHQITGGDELKGAFGMKGRYAGTDEIAVAGASVVGKILDIMGIEGGGSFKGKSAEDVLPKMMAGLFGLAPEGSQYDVSGKLFGGAGGASPEKDEMSKKRALEVYQLERQEFEQKRAFDRSVKIMNRDFERSEMLATFDYNKSRYRAERDHNRQITYANEDFQKSQFRAVRDFNRQIAITTESFNRGRMIANRDFQISLARNEYDYQKSRARAQYDHNWSIKTAMLQGDAWGVWQANRQFKIEKMRAEEDYQLSKSRSKEDFQRSQNDELVAFNIERANTLKGFEIQRADALIDFNIQRKRELEQYKIMRDDQEEDFIITRERTLFAKNQQLQDMVYMQTEETRLRYQQFIDQRIPEMYWEGDTANKIATANFTRVANKVNSILAGMGSGDFVYGDRQSSSAGGFQYKYDKGGYVGQTGMALVHSGEFVLTKDTVSAAEGLAKNNRLNQNELLNMMGGGGVNINNTFTRGMSADERFIIQQQFMQMAAGAFRK